MKAGLGRSSCRYKLETCIITSSCLDIQGLALVWYVRSERGSAFHGAEDGWPTLLAGFGSNISFKAYDTSSGVCGVEVGDSA